jgi:hypothetical protein
MSRSRRTVAAILLLSCALAASVSCWRAALRGPDFGALDDPFLKEGLPEIPRRSDEPVFRIILAGDAGLVVPDDPTLALLRKWGDEFHERTQVVYLGDNIYPAGLRSADRKRGEAVLLRLLRATRARKLFVPGNHDWGGTPTQYLSAGVLANQQAFIESHAALGADFEPKNGCPGPSEVQLLRPGERLSGGLALLALDLHWWLLPEAQRPPCEGVSDTTVFLQRFGEALKAHHDGNLVVVAHHPILSGGPHGGQSRGFWMDLVIFIGYPFFLTQDMIEPEYQEMVRLLREVMKVDPPLAMVGGHDHSLQVIENKEAARIVIVSGSASRVTGVTAIDGTLFAHAHLGFVIMDFFRLEGGTEETLLVRVVETGRGDDPVFTLAIDLVEEEAPAKPVPDPERGRGER